VRLDGCEIRDLPVTTDTRFLIGSISKAYTATIAMQLVDEGRIELDAPVREYLPELRLKDSRAAAVITTRQLLSHTSGIDDPPEEALAAEISLERFVATLESAAQRQAPAESSPIPTPGTPSSGVWWRWSPGHRFRRPSSPEWLNRSGWMGPSVRAQSATRRLAM
jgi:CubicO group peptidase (beta-lactamase class C family)